MACSATHAGVSTAYFILNSDDPITNYSAYLEFALLKYLEMFVQRTWTSTHSVRLLSLPKDDRMVLTVVLYENGREVILSPEQRQIIKKALKAFEPYNNMVVVSDALALSKNERWEEEWVSQILWLVDLDPDYETSVWNQALFVQLSEDVFEEQYQDIVLLVQHQITKMYNRGVWPIAKTVPATVTQAWNILDYRPDLWPEEQRFVWPNFGFFNTTFTPHSFMKILLTSSGTILWGLNIPDNYVSQHAIAKALHGRGVIPVFYQRRLWITLKSWTELLDYQRLISQVVGKTEGKVARMAMTEAQIAPLLKQFGDQATWYRTRDLDSPSYISILLPFEAEPVAIEQGLFLLSAS